MTRNRRLFRAAARALRAALPMIALLVAHPLAAQEEAPPREDTLTVPVVEQPLDRSPELPDIGEPATPGGAFLRSILVPGWGHASIGAYTRGGFYLTAQSSTVWMLVRTALRRSAARDIRTFRAGIVEDRLRQEGVEDPEEIAAALDGDPDVEAARALVRARDQQFEDWLALAIFLSFLGGADAFVSAHLADFPEAVQIGLRPVGDRVELGIRVAVPPIR